MKEVQPSTLLFESSKAKGVGFSKIHYSPFFLDNMENAIMEKDKTFTIWTVLDPNKQ